MRAGKQRLLCPPTCWGVVSMTVGNKALVALVRGRLTQDCRIAALAIDACCSEGSVSLIGFVDTHEQKRLVVELVTGMIGVKDVSDELVIRTPPTPAAAVSTGSRFAAA